MTPAILPWSLMSLHTILLSLQGWTRPRGRDVIIHRSCFLMMEVLSGIALISISASRFNLSGSMSFFLIVLILILGLHPSLIVFLILSSLIVFHLGYPSITPRQLICMGVRRHNESHNRPTFLYMLIFILSFTLES